jgi:hypothetical protein
MNETTTTDWQSIGKWKNGRVKSGAKAMIWISLLFGISFTGISLPAVLEIPNEINKGNYAILAALLFPLVGVSALALFVYSVMAWRKFGTTELVLDPVPGSIGGDFGGYIDIPVSWNPKNTVNITLNCQRLTTTGSGKNRSTKTKVIWQREGIATLSPVTGATHCEFRFAIPEDLPESEKSSSDYHQWLLQMDCELPGIDFKRNFTVPVFQTEKPQLSSLKAEYAKDSAPLDKAPDGIVRIQQMPQGLQFYYPWHRHLWMAIMTLVFGSIFAGIGIFVGLNASEILIPVVFSIVGGGCILLGLYLIGNTLTTTVSSQGINVVRNIYGIRFQRNVKANEIIKFDRQIKSQMNAGSNTRVYYSIIAHTRDNRKVTIADTLEGSRVADFVENRIREALGQKESSTTDEMELVIP